MAVVFVGQGDTVAVASWDGIQWWDIKSRALVKSVSTRICSAAVSADHRTLAAYDGVRSVRIWDVLAKTQSRTFEVSSGPEDYSLSVAGRSIAVVSAPHGRTIDIYPIDGGRPAHHVFTDQIACAALAPGGNTVAIAHSNGIIRMRGIDSPQDNHVATISFRPVSAAFNEDATLIAIGGEAGRVTVLDASTLGLVSDNTLD